MVTTLNRPPSRVAVFIAASQMPTTGTADRQRAASSPTSSKQAITTPSMPGAVRSWAAITSSRPGTANASS